MAEIGSAFLTIAPSMKGFGGALNAQAGGTIRSSGKSLGAAFGKAFILGGSLLAAAGIGSFLKGSIDEAREAQKTGAATASILKATGGAANLTAKQIGNLSSALSAKTAVDDEQIQAGANLLLTFKNVKKEGQGLNDIFGRATAAGLDLAAAGFGSIEGNAKQLGKALNDPVKGITALSRAGVTFTAGQQAQIKGFVAANDLLSAQKVILGEVEKQVGGTAAATATSGEKAAVAFGNIKEQVGTALLPAIDGFFNLFLSQVPRITALINGIGPALSGVQTFLAPFVAQVQGFFGGSGGSAITSFAASVRTNLIPVLQAAGTTLTTQVLPAVGALASYLATSLAPVLRQAASIISTQVLPIYRSLATFFYGTVLPAAVSLGRAIATNLRPSFEALIEVVKTDVLPNVRKLLAVFNEYKPELQTIATFLLKATVAFIKVQSAITGKVLPVVIRLIGFLGGGLVGAIADYIARAGEGLRKTIAFGQGMVEFAQTVRAKITAVVGFIKGLPGKITAALGNVKTLLVRAGGDIIQGLINGIESKIGAVRAKLKSLTNLIPKVKGPPSKDAILLRPAGQMIMDGLIDGIASREKALVGKLGKVTKAMRDKVAEAVDGLKSDFASLSSSVSDNLTGNLFSGFDTASSFLGNLNTVKGNLGGALADFKTLKGFGLSGKFLAQLFSDGGFPLIHELAADKAAASAAGSIFGDIQSLSGQLGDNVAKDLYGDRLDQQIALLSAIDKKLDKMPDKTGASVGGAVNGAATSGKKRGNKGKGN